MEPELAESLRPEHADVLKALRDIGGVDCSGNCRIRKPGEVHCQAIAETLKISPTSVKDMIQQLVTAGFVERERVDIGGKRFVTRFTVSPLAERTLEDYDNRL